MNEKKKGSCIWILLVPIGLLLLLAGGCAACFCAPTTDNSTTQTQEVKEKEEEIIKEEPKDFLTLLNENIGNSELADHVYSILVNDIGFEKLEFIKRIGDTNNYEITAESIKMMITAVPADGEEPEYIRVFEPQSDIYYEDGEVLKTGESLRKENEHFNNAESYYIIAQSIIKDVANTSNKMKFPDSYLDCDDIGYGWVDDYVVVKSFVEIKNNYGVYEKFDYMVEFIPTDLSNYQYEVVYVNFGGSSDGNLVEVDSLYRIRY
jgi:hypothetical protein